MVCGPCCGCCKSHDEDEEVQEMKGETLEGGFVVKRKRRDLLWLLLFIVFLFGMFLIAGVAIDRGQPERLIYGTDSFGNICSKNNDAIDGIELSGADMSNHRFLYYWDVGSPQSGIKICVESCPSADIATCSQSDGGNCDVAKVCYGSGSDSTPYNVAGITLVCPDNGLSDDVYNSEAISSLHRCIPVADTLLDVYSSVNPFGSNLEEAIADFANAWDTILYSLLVCLGAAFVLILLMRCLAAPIVYLSIFLGWAIFVAFTAYLGKEYKDLYDKENKLNSEKRNEKVFLGMFIALLVFTVILTLLIISLRTRIRLTVSIFEETSHALARMPSLYLTPIYTYLILAAWIAYWIVVYVYLATSKEPTAVPGDNPGDAARVDYVESGDYQQMWWYHLFGLLWVSQFILACEEIALAGAFSNWYFTRDKSWLSCSYLSSIGRLVKYSLGSAALGSLVIALIQLVRIILAYIKKKLKKKSKFADYALKCLSCCMWCFEKCMKFLNKNAYIEIAIYGYSFCTAAREAFFVIIHNALRVSVLNGISVFVLFVMRLLVVGIVAIIALQWLENDEDLTFYGLVLLAIMVFSFFVADIFLDVYKMGIDTIFICFCEDDKRNDGSTAKPYYGSQNLRKYFKNASKETADMEDDD